jgi:hypothetical protein
MPDRPLQPILRPQAPTILSSTPQVAVLRGDVLLQGSWLSGTFWRSDGIRCHGGYSSTSVVMCMALSVAGRSRSRHDGYTVPLIDGTCMAWIETERLTPRENYCTSRNSCIVSSRRRSGELLSVSSLLLRYSCAWPRPCRSMWSRRSASSIACPQQGALW